MDEQAPRRRRRPPQIQQIPADETEQINSIGKEEVAPQLKSSTPPRKKKSLLPATISFIALVIVVIIVECYLYLDIPFLSSNKQIRQIQTIKDEYRADLPDKSVEHYVEYINLYGTALNAAISEKEITAFLDYSKQISEVFSKINADFDSPNTEIYFDSIKNMHYDILMLHWDYTQIELGKSIADLTNAILDPYKVTDYDDKNTVLHQIAVLLDDTLVSVKPPVGLPAF